MILNKTNRLKRIDKKYKNRGKIHLEQKVVKTVKNCKKL